MSTVIVAVSWSGVAASANIIALVIFAVALCWRLDEIRRRGGGLQALAMTVSIAALTLAFVVFNGSVNRTIDDALFAGLGRLLFYGLLAVGVAALIIVLFFPGGGVTRERRAGTEAIPLVVALIGLQVCLLVVPSDIRSASVSGWSLQNWGFALFFLIASAYLAYGFGSCVNNVRKYLLLADGYLKIALSLMVTGLALLAAGSVVQILYVVGSATKVADLPVALTASRVLAIIGVVVFLFGICFPLVHSQWQAWKWRSRCRRDAATILPLWRLVTGVVPEVVLPTRRLSATAMLHRRVIEIRDALTQLSPLLPAHFAEVGSVEQAQSLLDAVARAHSDGRGSGAVRPILPESGDGLIGDAAPLIELAETLRALPRDSHPPDSHPATVAVDDANREAADPR
ncbi:MAG: hypothetical protein QM662_18295 [Gordonia sp. (in: high G+C Gram-positive bacteria)]